ncbi:unnamed protein product [Owenia fusiformis]|uniref:Sialate O-acetylesterase domain-containing protein n=1 Tax=Owenia fusiformis TaxID=6347 RepID=A0A8S4Q5Q5_OWEFU|nr:unnamed protein product [Owenia fusiformis]
MIFLHSCLAVYVLVICAKANVLERQARQSGVFRFANYYQNSMVLQRAPTQANVWGYAGSVAVGTSVNVNVAGKDYTTTVQTSPAGNVWEVKLDAIAAGGPYTVTATSSGQTATLTDVLFGDIWLCSGQSNMEHPVHRMDDPDDEMNNAGSFPNVRLMNVPHLENAQPQYDVSSIALPWQRASRNGVYWFSAICWLFGKEIHRRQNIPVGLIGSNWGGTRIEAWMSPEARGSCNADTESIQGPNDPSHLWNAMVHPFLPMAMTGALWYQGESNRNNAEQYACLFPAMINDWRARFNARGGTPGDFPFGFVQLAPWRNQLVQTGFPDVRWSQTANIGYVPNNNMPRTFMAVAIDTPDYNSPWGSIHPRYKRPLAERLLYGGLNVAYGDASVRHQGPFPTNFTLDGSTSSIIITYDNGQTQLQFGTSGPFEVCCSTSDGATCGDAGTSWEAAIVSEENASSGVTITFSCLPTMQSVVGVRYAWQESPCELNNCSVYSVENNLPAPPFIHNGLIG